ncbi:MULTISPECIES: hypothetical protein [unclassified Pseudonocardia]|uniref:hypothetical protein n=1 Tax=unclassified Pseudonocardia TaxID=2619320 RepID=UPI0011153D19|nr:MULTISPECIES: hypothetical protein [unclassified Pseudonocardia]
MNQNQTQRLRDHYDSHSTADQMEGGHWEADTYPNPMVGTSLRLPKDLLDWIRARAQTEGVTPALLMRRWIEQRRAAEQDAADRVEQRIQTLEEAVLAVGAAVQTPSDTLRDALRRLSTSSVPAQQDARQQDARSDTPAAR